MSWEEACGVVDDGFGVAVVSFSVDRARLTRSEPATKACFRSTGLVVEGGAVVAACFTRTRAGTGDRAAGASLRSAGLPPPVAPVTPVVTSCSACCWASATAETSRSSTTTSISSSPPDTDSDPLEAWSLSSSWSCVPSVGCRGGFGMLRDALRLRPAEGESTGLLDASSASRSAARLASRFA